MIRHTTNLLDNRSSQAAQIAELRAIVEAQGLRIAALEAAQATKESRRGDVRERRQRVAQYGRQLHWLDAGRRKHDGEIIDIIINLVADHATGEGPSAPAIRRDLIATLGEPRSR
jgi:hypothetical protein